MKTAATEKAAPLILYGFSSSMSAGFYTGQLRYLRQAGYQVVVTSSPGHEVDRLAKSELVAYFPIQIMREISPLRDLASLIKLYRLIRRLRPAISNFGTPKAGLLGGMAAYLARVPCRVYTLHGLRLETATGLKRRILWSAEWLACRLSHTTVCVSQSLRSKTIELGLLKPGSGTVLANGSCNGIDTRRFEKSMPGNIGRLRKALGIPAQAPVIGFVGRFVRDKGIAELIEAFRILSVRWPSLRLLLVGDFEDGDPVPASLRTLISSESRIVRTGFVDDPERFYHLMDVFVLPTYREGLPGTALEAQASAVPVVTTRATGAIDSVADGVTGMVVEVADASSLANSIHRLLDDPGLRARMGAAGRMRVRQKFAPETIWHGIADLYAELTQSRLGIRIDPAANLKDKVDPQSFTSASAD